jgi:hypothetical protein
MNNIITHSVPLNVEPASTACHSSNERTTGKWVSHNGEHCRRMLVGGLRVTWDTVQKKPLLQFSGKLKNARICLLFKPLRKGTHLLNVSHIYSYGVFQDVIQFRASLWCPVVRVHIVCVYLLLNGTAFSAAPRGTQQMSLVKQLPTDCKSAL